MGNLLPDILFRFSQSKFSHFDHFGGLTLFCLTLLLGQFHIPHFLTQRTLLVPEPCRQLLDLHSPFEFSQSCVEIRGKDSRIPESTAVMIYQTKSVTDFL